MAEAHRRARPRLTAPPRLGHAVSLGAPAIRRSPRLRPARPRATAPRPPVTAPALPRALERRGSVPNFQKLFGIAITKTLRSPKAFRSPKSLRSSASRPGPMRARVVYPTRGARKLVISAPRAGILCCAARFARPGDPADPASACRPRRSGPTRSPPTEGGDRNIAVGARRCGRRPRGGKPHHRRLGDGLRRRRPARRRLRSSGRGHARRRPGGGLLLRLRRYPPSRRGLPHSAAALLPDLPPPTRAVADQAEGPSEWPRRLGGRNGLAADGLRVDSFSPSTSAPLLSLRLFLTPHHSVSVSNFRTASFCLQD